MDDNPIYDFGLLPEITLTANMNENQYNNDGSYNYQWQGSDYSESWITPVTQGVNTFTSLIGGIANVFNDFGTPEPVNTTQPVETVTKNNFVSSLAPLLIAYLIFK